MRIFHLLIAFQIVSTQTVPTAPAEPTSLLSNGMSHAHKKNIRVKA